MHEDLERALAELAATSDAFLKLASPLSPSGLNWRPSPGSWSIGQCIDHVATTNGRMLPLLDRAIADAREAGRLSDGPFRYGWIARWFLSSTGPSGRRMSAPAPYRPSLSALEPVETLERYRSVAARLANAARAADGLDLGRVRVPSAALPILRLPLGIWFLSLAAHERRHLNQASAVRLEAGFGSAA